MPAEAQQSVGMVSVSLAKQTEGFVRDLRKRHSSVGSLDILRLAVMLAEQAVSRLMGPRTFACEKGCSYCCHLKVEAFDHEVYGIVAYVLSTWSRDDVFALYYRLRDKAAQSAGLDPQEYLEKKISCIFLSEEGTCRVYPVRPIACVAYHSMSKEECITAHDNPAEPWVTQVAEIIIGVHGVSLGVLNVVDPTLMSKPRQDNPPNLHELLLPVLRERIKSRYGLNL
jgi:Fe-S-cluster containining protein